jgi:Spy/CpxP family protein refolding chaperone
VAHEELAGALDQLVSQLHGLGARWREHFAHRESRGTRPLISLMLRHREELGLSREQVQSLERLRADFQRDAIRREADIRIAESELETLLAAEAVDLEQVEAKLRAIAQLGADLRLSRIRAIEQGKGLLTQEQLAKLRALLGDPRASRIRAHAPRSRDEHF